VTVRTAALPLAASLTHLKLHRGNVIYYNFAKAMDVYIIMTLTIQFIINCYKFH